VHDLKRIAMLETGYSALEAPLADIAPGTHDV
jgi:hypothetical protein